MTAMVSGPQDAPAAADPAPSPAAAQVRESFAIVRTAHAATQVPSATVPLADRSARAARPAAASRTPDPVVQRAERLVMLDAQLLDDRTLGDIRRRAAIEDNAGKR